MTQTTTVTPEATTTRPNRDELYNPETGLLRTPAELAAVHDKPKAKAKSRKVSVLPKAGKQTKDAAPVSKPAARKHETLPVCAMRKKDGTACTAHVMRVDGAPADFCTDHRPAHLHLTEAEIAWVHKALDTDDRGIVERAIGLLGWGQVRERARKQQGGAL